MTENELKKINEQLAREYDKIYELEEKGKKVPGYYIALHAWDYFFEWNEEFVCEITKLRGDMLSSDRECVAFMFAMEKLGYLR